MNAVKSIIFATTLFLAYPVFAQDEPSLSQLQAKSLATKQQEKVNEAAQLRYVKSLYRHAMQVFARGVQSLVKSGVKVKTSSRREAEANSDYAAADEGAYSVKEVPTDYSPYISIEYAGTKGDTLWVEGDPGFELVGGETVSMTLPFGPNFNDLLGTNDLANLVSDSGKPLDSCAITITFNNGTADEDGGKTSALSCTPFLQGKYDDDIIALIQKRTREAIVANQQ